MRKIFLLAILLLIVISCSKSKKPIENTMVSNDTISDTVSMIYKVEKALIKTADLDKKIEKKVVDAKVLLNQNNILKKELKVAKDSLDYTKEQLIKSKFKVAKKQGFFGRLIGKKPDSVEIEKVDTIKK